MTDRSNRVCGKIHPYIVLFSLVRSSNVETRAFLNVCRLSLDNQLPRWLKEGPHVYIYFGHHIGGETPPTWSLHTGICKFEQNISPFLPISYNITISCLYSLNIFRFIFSLRDCENDLIIFKVLYFYLRSR